MEKRYSACVRVDVCIVYIMEIWRRYSVISYKNGYYNNEKRWRKTTNAKGTKKWREATKIKQLKQKKRSKCGHLQDFSS